MGEYVDPESEQAQESIRRLFQYGQVGRCVSSVTHDLNNVLGAIMAYAELLELELKDNDADTGIIGEIVGGARKCSDLVNNLTAIARKERPDFSMVDPGAMVERVLDFRRHDLKVARISLESIAENPLPGLFVHRPKVERALIYLMMNAEEAVTGRDRPLIRVRASRAINGVEICVWDSGPPVPADERDRIFEPWYSSKGEGHLGLGLPLARAVAEMHAGTLTCDPDRGFVLYLPCDGGQEQ